ncbi:hypothetical protein GCM10020331_070170 [Ectobacillus funiculus]
MEEVVALLQTIQQNKHAYNSDSEASLNMQINALVTANAEAYYQAMVTHDDKSWNIRDRHMVEALDSIGHYYGAEAKGIVWEHNTHIGDARATDMARQGLENVGQLSREKKYGQEHIYSIGFWHASRHCNCCKKLGRSARENDCAKKRNEAAGKIPSIKLALLISILCLQRKIARYSSAQSGTALSGSCIILKWSILAITFLLVYRTDTMPLFT